MADKRQASVHPFRDMNRYKGRNKDWRSDEVFKPPRRTKTNDWVKYHATSDCGSRVCYIEDTKSALCEDKYEYKLMCKSCGFEVDEDEVLFIGGQWWKDYGATEYGGTLEDLYLPEERVVGLGPNPDRTQLIEALNITRIENEVELLGINFSKEDCEVCTNCEREALLTFDSRCRMCYDGKWTRRMQESVNAAERTIRERKNSYVHRLQSNVDPLSTTGQGNEGKILWRRHDNEDIPKVVEIKRCLKDPSNGHREYVLTDIKRTTEWLYDEDEVSDCFWDTGMFRQDGDGISLADD